MPFQFYLCSQDGYKYQLWFDRWSAQAIAGFPAARPSDDKASWRRYASSHETGFALAHVFEAAIENAGSHNPVYRAGPDHLQRQSHDIADYKHGYRVFCFVPACAFVAIILPL